MVYSILWHFLRDRSLAEELAQEVFLELYQNWKSVKSPRHLVFWLRRVTTHRAIDLVRKRKIRPKTSLEESGEPSTVKTQIGTVTQVTLHQGCRNINGKKQQ